jgi:hypothetical protein
MSTFPTGIEREKVHPKERLALSRQSSLVCHGG